MTTDAPVLEDAIGVGDYQYGFHDPTDKYVFQSRRGLDRDIVHQISEMKNEPKWMRERLESELRRAGLRLDPDNPYYIDSLGWAYYRMGKLEEARGELERAVKLGAEESEVLEHLGDVDLALHRTVDAKSNYTKALQLDPTRAQLVKKLQALR